MKLTPEEMSRLKELTAKVASGKISPTEKKELAALIAKKKAKDGGGRNRRGKSHSNDVDWWKKYPKVIGQAANVTFNYIKGEPLPGGTINGSTHYPRLSSGLKLNYLRTPGVNINGASAWNYQLRSLYLDINRKYRNMGSYQPSDLGMGLWAVTNLFADIARAKKIYGLLYNYKILDRTFPTVVLKSMGFDPYTITRQEIADFRYQLNAIIAKAHSLCLPKGMGVLSSLIELETGVWKDSDSARAGWFYYDCPYMYVYDQTTLSYTGSPAPGGCVVALPRSKSGGIYTLGSVIDDLTTCIDALFNSNDVARYCADLIATYGDEEMVTSTYLEETYITEAIRDDYRLLQLHNTTICDQVRGTKFNPQMTTDLMAAYSAYSLSETQASLTLYQVGSNIYYQLANSLTGEGAFVTDSNGLRRWVTPYTSGSTRKLISYDKVYLDVWKDDVTEDDIIEMTRQTVAQNRVVFSVSGTTYNEYNMYFGNIVVTTLEFWYTDNTNGLPTIYALGPFGMGHEWSTTPGIMMPFFRLLAMLEQFDWHPMIWFVWDNSGTFENMFFWDCDNIQVVDRLTIMRLHDACMMSGLKFDKVSIASE